MLYKIVTLKVQPLSLFIIKKNRIELKYQNIMNIYHINSYRQLLNSYLKCLKV